MLLWVLFVTMLFTWLKAVMVIEHSIIESLLTAFLVTIFYVIFKKYHKLTTKEFIFRYTTYAGCMVYMISSTVTGIHLGMIRIYYWTLLSMLI